MNPFALLLLAAAAGGGRAPNMGNGSTPIKLDSVLEQLHSTVNTLEKVNELSRMGSNMTNSFSLPSPSMGHAPVSTEPVNALEPQDTPAPGPSLPNIDLQGAMQALGPILSMLGNNQSSR